MGTAKLGPQAKTALGKLRALWIAGWNLGVIRDRRDQALFAFIKRQTVIDHPRFLVNADDSLKAMLRREAGVDWGGKSYGAGDKPPKELKPQHAVLRAQFDCLDRLGQIDRASVRGLDGWAQTFTGKADLKAYDGNDWMTAMNAAGELVRAALSKRCGS
ncbi:MAG: phage protein GemA/Gp16 family protein [Pseudomonadota bacterium]